MTDSEVTGLIELGSRVGTAAVAATRRLPAKVLLLLDFLLTHWKFRGARGRWRHQVEFQFGEWEFDGHERHVRHQNRRRQDPEV